MSLLSTARMRLRDPQLLRYITGKPDTAEDTRAMTELVKERWIKFGFSWWGFVDIVSAQWKAQAALRGHDD